MNKFFVNLVLFFMLCGYSHLTLAQVLEDDTAPSFQTPESVATSQTSSSVDEELFDELFSDFPDTEKDITKIKTFDDVVSRASEQIQPSVVSDDSSFVMLPQELPPLTGDIQIGITKNSFKVYKDMAGRIKCRFSVTLQSTLDRSIKVLGLSLIYPKRSFAFIFREVPINGKQVHYITTAEDICYALAGIPDIDIHKCKIRGASGAECAQRIKWSDAME